MYSGSGTQVCNMPSPTCYGPPFSGPYPPMYPGATPYFAPPNEYKYPYQGVSNSGPIDHRFTQNEESRMHNVPQPPVSMPVPPMNMPMPFPQFNGQFNYPPPMPFYPNFSMMPPNAPATNHFSSMPPQYPPPPSGLKVDRERRHPHQQKNHKSRQEKAQQFHCESCDKDFYSSKNYEQHLSEHVTCGLEGCTFKAHALIVEKHIAMQHRNGLFNRIAKGNTPQEITNWILERKKFYPTKDKIVEKQVQKFEMEKRGERYNDREKPSHKRHNNPTDSRNRQKFPHGSKTPGNNTRNFGLKSALTNQKPRNDDSKTPAVRREPKTPAKKREPAKTIDDGYEYQRNLPPFRGTAYYLSSRVSNDDIEDSDLDSVENITNESICEEEFATIPEPRKVLSSLDLIRGYDTSEESDNCDEPTVTTKPPEVPQVDDEDDDDSGPEECSFKLPVPSFILGDLATTTVPLDKKNEKENVPELINSQSSCPDKIASDKEENNSNSKKIVRKRRKSRSGKSDDDKGAQDEKKSEIESKTKPETILPRKRYRPPTLLEKLLAPEIKHERNVILQCVRYIVNQNYFDIGSNTNAGPSST